MWEVIVGILISTGIGVARKWRHWGKVENIAHAIVKDPTNPITDPKEALEQAVIIANHAQTKKRAANLGKRLELAQQRAERIRQDEAADPHSVELIEPDGTEVFK